MEMKGDLIIVNLSFEETIEKVRDGVLNEGMSTELVDEYGDGNSFYLLVFDKYYMRASNRVSLTVHISTDGSNSKVYSVGSGGGQGSLFSFDWGASDDFSGVVRNILGDYII